MATMKEVEQLRRGLPEHPFLERAYSLAEKLHRGQERKHSGDPYIIHPVRVALRIYRELGRVSKTASYAASVYFGLGVALLHDVVEDTDVLLQDLAESLEGSLDPAKIQAPGDQKTVGELVVEELVPLTINPAFKGLRRYRKVAQNAQIRGGSVLARVIKLSDRLDNLQEFQLRGPDQRFVREKYIPETVDLLEAIQSANRTLPDNTWEMYPWGDHVEGTLLPQLESLIENWP